MTWKKIDKTIPIQNLPEGRCLYAREYHAGKGYDATPTNSLISNFKRKTDKKVELSKDEKHYRNKSIKIFANELSILFREKTPVYITHIPCSVVRSDQNYDDRFDLLFQELSKLVKENGILLKQVEPIVLKSNREPSHHNPHGKRSSEKIKESYLWKGFGTEDPEHLIVVDDIITTGSQFCAYYDVLKNHFPNLDVYGLFWARSIKAATMDGLNK